MFGSVKLHLQHHGIENRLFIFGFFHVDKIDYDDSSHISEAELSSNFFSSYQVGFKRCRFLVTLLIGLIATVDVDDVQGFGVLYNHVSPRRKTNGLSKQAFDLLFDSKTFK